MSADRFSITKQSLRCPDIEARLYDYMDSSLSMIEMQAIEAHLSVCKGCRREAEQIRNAEAALIASPLSIPAPGDLYAGFANKLAANRSKSPVLRMMYFTPAFALAAAALFLIRYERPIDTIRRESTSVAKRDESAIAALLPQVGSRIPGDAVSKSVARSVTARQVTLPGRSNTLRIRNTGLIGKHSPRVAFNLPRRHFELTSVRFRRSSNLAMLAESLPELKIEAQKSPAALIRSQLPVESGQRSSDLYAMAYRPTPADLPIALGLEARSYTNVATGFAVARDAQQSSASGFKLIVQDDVRGFTAEADNTIPSTLPAAHSASAVDDGVRVEVEFDPATTSF